MFLQRIGAQMTKPRAPRNLAAGGRRLWDSVLASHTLRADEIRVLEDACREADLIDEMESEQRGASKTTRGSMGQVVAAPLVSELRQHRATLTTMLRSLNLDKAQVADAVAEAQRAVEARRAELAAAQERWVNRKEGIA